MMINHGIKILLLSAFIFALYGAENNVPAPVLEAFYMDSAPDLLEELKKRQAEDSGEAAAYLELLEKHYLKMEAVRNENEDEYKRLIKQQRTESSIRILSAKIQAAVKNKDDKLPALKNELKTLMLRSFDEAQERQMIEIVRLENEVKALRQLAKDRADNKIPILVQRYLLLTGQQWNE